MNDALRIHIETKLKPVFETAVQFHWQRVSGGSINETFKISTLNHAFLSKQTR